MDAVTYPDDTAIEIVNKHTRPVRVPHTAKLDIIDVDVAWTPALFMVTPQGKMLQESTGFLPAEELIPWILLGTAKMQFKQKELDPAVDVTNRILSDYPESRWAAEALYWKSVSQFLQSHDAPALKEGYAQLKQQYPDSIWAKKAMPYRLL